MDTFEWQVDTIKKGWNVLSLSSYADSIVSKKKLKKCAVITSTTATEIFTILRCQF